MNAVERILNFYDQRGFREKLLLVPLSFVFWYLLYDYLLISPIDTANAEREKQVIETKNKIDLVDRETTLLYQLMHSHLYQEWNKQKLILSNLQQKYNEYTKSYSPTNSQQIVTLLLTNKENINILEIKNGDSHPFKSAGKLLKSKIVLQKPYFVNLSGNYENFYYFIKRIETVLKNVQWNRVTYSVTNYPEANVMLEFSILYEKT